MNSERRLRLLRNTINTNIQQLELAPILHSIEECIHKASMVEGKSKCTSSALALSKDSLLTIIAHYKLEGLTVQTSQFNYNQNDVSVGVLIISWEYLENKIG